MTERLTSADPIEAWRKAAAKADNPATWKVGDELRGRAYARGWVREQGRTAVLIEWASASVRKHEWVTHHAAAREWRRYGPGCPDDIEN